MSDWFEHAERTPSIYAAFDYDELLAVIALNDQDPETIRSDAHSLLDDLLVTAIREHLERRAASAQGGSE